MIKKKCKYCGNEFIPMILSDTQYCSRKCEQEYTLKIMQTGVWYNIQLGEEMK